MLAFLELKEDYFKNGEKMGRFGAAAFHHFMQESVAWQALLKWLTSAELQQMATLIEQYYPSYWQELSGLAKGLEVEFEKVLLWNCRGDLWALTPDGCTTVQIPTENFTLAHNEDGDPLFNDHCALAHVCTESEEFVSFLYPGSIPGHTFALNQHGLALSVNNLRLQNKGVGIPRMVLTRATMSARNATEVMTILNKYHRAGGFHLTTAHIGDRQMHSIEFNPYHCSIKALQLANIHANHMIHETMREYPQLITGSSAFRQIVGEQLLAQGIAPLSILASQDNLNYPIYRDSLEDSDNENTLATVCFIANGKDWDWTVYQANNMVMRFKNCELL